MLTLICILLNVNDTVYPCKICCVNISDKDSAAQCDICWSCVHMKCNKLNHIDYKYLQGSNDPWYCLSSCIKTFPFGTLTKKDLTSSIANSYFQGPNSNNDKESLLLLKLHFDLALLYNQFNNISQKKKKNNDPENVVNSKYYDIELIQTLKFPEKHRCVI